MLTLIPVNHPHLRTYRLDQKWIALGRGSGAIGKTELEALTLLCIKLNKLKGGNRRGRL